MLTDWKLCSKCGEIKPVDVSFHKDISRKDGLDPRCKECRQKYYRDRRDKLKRRGNNW